MSDTLSGERLAEIEAAATADGLTEGPWQPLYESCDCGGDYGCGHGQYVWAINTPALAPFWSGRTMPDGELPDHAYDRSELSEFTSADLEFIAEARTAVPELLAEVKRLNTELAKYVGWEPTVREEYEHACEQVEAVIEIVRGFKRDNPELDDAATAFLASLEKALEIW